MYDGLILPLERFIVGIILTFLNGFLLLKDDTFEDDSVCDVGWIGGNKSRLSGCFFLCLRDLFLMA